MDVSSSKSNPDKQNRQKRVLPSRSRGGPGVGSCETDIMILDTLKRKWENEPLIPLDTPFILTTDPSLTMTSSSMVQFGINSFANERYFDRPEVLKAYREQSIIQTPEFLSLVDTPNVGGRFRPRGPEDAITDCSDAAYEKRHRKHETLEKRQRLREKEKLKHEHYKLKERIEQLRAMDSAAFMSLPASAFPSLRTPEVIEDSARDEAGGSTSGSTTGYDEGERRRKDTLEAAMSLEERYSILLPSKKMRKVAARNSENMSAEPTDLSTSSDIRDNFPDDGESEVEVERATLAQATQQGVEKIKFKIKLPVGLSIPRSSPSLKKKLRASPASSNQSFTRKRPLLPPTPKSHLSENDDSSYGLDAGPSFQSNLSPSQPTTRQDTPMSNPEIAVLPLAVQQLRHDEHHLADVGDEFDVVESPTITEGESKAKRRYKRVEYSATSSGGSLRAPSAPPIETIFSINHAASPSYTTSTKTIPNFTYTNSDGQTRRTSSVLLIAALRASNGKKSRKGMRHAFGINIPRVLGEERDFELPEEIFRSMVENKKGESGAHEHLAESSESRGIVPSQRDERVTESFGNIDVPTNEH